MVTFACTPGGGLARELHDATGQNLSANPMETEGAEYADQPADVRGHLNAIKSLA